jgi:hypothetical protein
MWKAMSVSVARKNKPSQQGSHGFHLDLAQWEDQPVILLDPNKAFEPPGGVPSMSHAHIAKAPYSKQLLHSLEELFPLVEACPYCFVSNLLV